MEVLQRTANRGSISTGGYEVANSCKFESDNDEWLSKTGTTGNRRTWTYSTWIKRTEIGNDCVIFSARNAGSNAGYFGMEFRAGDTFHLETYYTTLRYTDRLFRDTSAWYHIVVVCDSTQSTASNRLKLYVNGVEETSFSSGNNNMDQNFEFAINNNIEHRVGNSYYSGRRFNGYIAETHLVDGTSLLPTDFGEFDDDSGIWKPKEYTGNYGNNGFYLDFKDSSNMGNDANGGTDFTENNIAAADQATDTPTNNFCTISTPFEPLVGGPPTITEGATIMTAGSSGQQDSYGTMALFKGKWYFEFSVLNVGGLAIANMFGGVVKVNRLLQSSYNNAANGHHSHDGGWGGGVNAVGVHSGSGSGFSAVSGSAVDVVVGVAVDMDNGKIWWASGGTYASSSGTVSNPATATLPQFTNLLTQYPGEPVVPAFNHYVHQATTQGAFNFGNPFDHAFTDIGTNSDANGYGSFAYTPPSGYYAICSKNLAEYG